VIWFAIGMAAGAVIGWLVVNRLKNPKPKYFAACEYWVYLPEDKGPTQEAVLTRMVRDNPYKVGGRPAIGKHEGMVFSDIRLHVALVLRSKNPHVFRPDLFEEHVEPTAEDLQNLGESKALQKIRFISEEPLIDYRHLQFLPHMAAAVADLAGSHIIFDTVSERLISASSLAQSLKENGDASRAAMHLRVVWKNDSGTGIVQTKGLLKVGVPEIETEPTDVDERILVMTVMEEVANQIWEARSMPVSLMVEAFQDMFEVQFTPARKGPYKARIFRTQTA
jgi:hypothetical protein